MNQPEQREEAVFEAALHLSADQRAAYLDQTCASDAELRRRVEALLGAFERAGGFLKQPATPERTVRFSLPPTEKPGDRIGRYKLLQQIGEGGCGVVYMAEQEEPVRRRVALKVIKLGMDTKQVIARFEAERQALALMDHPNIAQVLDAGATETGRPYFVMELVRGVKITDFCDQKNLSTRARLDLFIQVCRAVQHAHQKGIIHRDLKPSNILVTSDDGVPVPKVIDFGIAKATQGRLTDHTVFTALEQFIGTPAYMSPEQAEMSLRDIDTRTDIYSLGVLLYELLTGQTPFDAKELLAAGLDAMRRTLREVEPVKPSTVVERLSKLRVESGEAPAAQCGSTLNSQLKSLSTDLDWIVMKCLEKDRQRRYETANGLAADLNRHLNDQPVVARPPSRIYEFQKTVRRHKFGFAAAAAILLVLAVGIALTTWQAVRASRAKRAEEQAQQTARIEADRADAAANDSKRTLSRSDFLQAVRLIAEDNANDALPYLARSLSVNPANDAAMTRLATLLTYRTWMLPTLILKHEKPVNSAEFSPEGKRIVTASADGTARVWDARTGQPLLEPMKHAFSVTAAQFSPNGKRIVTVSDDMTTRVWDAQTGQPVAEPMKHGSLVVSVQFSPDGKRLVTGSFDNTARIWDAETGLPLTNPLGEEVNGGKYSVNMVSARTSVDGETTVGISMTKPVTARFTPEGERVVTIAGGGTPRVWNARTGKPLSDPADQASPAWSKQLSPDGQQILKISGNNTAQVLEALTGPPVPLRSRLPLVHGGGSFSQWSQPLFSHDGRRVVMPSDDKTACVWDAQTGESLTRMIHEDGVASAQFSPDDRLIVTTTWDYSANTSAVRVWEAQTGQPLVEPLKHEGYLYSVEFSPDGRRFVTASHSGSARVWDAQTGLPLTEPLKHRGGVLTAHFSPEGKRIVTASGDKTARLWDAQTGQPLVEPMKHGREVNSAQFSLDGKRIVTGSSDSTARVWDARTGQPLTEAMKHGDPVNSAQFSPDGKRIITASLDGITRLWDAQTGQPLTEPMQHSWGRRAAQFSPDGERAVSVPRGGRTARVWDAQTGQPLTEPMTHPGSGELFSARFSPDGKRIVTGSILPRELGKLGGGEALVWDVSPSQVPCPDWLLQITEVISGKVLNQEGVLESTRLNRLETLNQIRQKLAAQPEDDWVVWGRWLLADRATRTISPFAKVAVPEYLERLIQEKSRQSLDEAEPLAAGKPEILQRISEARETLEPLKK